MADTPINELNSGFPSVDRVRLAGELNPPAQPDPLADIAERLGWIACALNTTGLVRGHAFPSPNSPGPHVCQFCGYPAAGPRSSSR